LIFFVVRILVIFEESMELEIFPNASASDILVLIWKLEIFSLLQVIFVANIMYLRATRKQKLPNNAIMKILKFPNADTDNISVQSPDPLFQSVIQKTHQKLLKPFTSTHSFFHDGQPTDHQNNFFCSQHSNYRPL